MGLVCPNDRSKNSLIRFEHVYKNNHRISRLRYLLFTLILDILLPSHKKILYACMPVNSNYTLDVRFMNSPLFVCLFVYSFVYLFFTPHPTPIPVNFSLVISSCCSLACCFPPFFVSYSHDRLVFFVSS